jgi:N-dimethylarginine dimethylaminohydrolase
MTASVLMCRPDHFGIEYEINPWMHVAVQVDHALAASQWDALYRTYLDLGVQVELAAPVAGLPDMVFTANAAVLWDDRAVLSNFHHAERQGEEKHWRQELERLNFEVHELPRSLSFEGAGDALFVGDRLFCGYGFRTDRDSHRPVARILEVEVASLELVDPRFYHLDTCFCPLAGGKLLYYPPAFTPQALAQIHVHVAAADRIEASAEEAQAFCVNAVNIGRQIVMAKAPESLRGKLNALGYQVHEVDLAPFILSGGGAYCMTLRLDRKSRTHAVLRAAE